MKALYIFGKLIFAFFTLFSVVCVVEGIMFIVSGDWQGIFVVLISGMGVFLWPQNLKALIKIWKMDNSEV